MKPAAASGRVLYVCFGMYVGSRTVMRTVLFLGESAQACGPPEGEGAAFFSV